MNGVRSLCALILSVGMAGCLRPTQAVLHDVDPYDWHDGVAVEVENGDTVTLRDVSLVIRSNRLFRADSLLLEIFVETPDSMHCTETVAFPMSHPRKAAALRTVVEIPYRRHVVFDRIGVYRFTLAPAEPIEGIEAAGINIVKSTE